MEMYTSISIIDKHNSKVSDVANIRLLWSAVLMGETVNACCEPMSIFYLILVYDSLPEKQKFIIYLNMLKKNPEMKNEDIKLIEDYYSKVIRARKMQGKRKEHLILLVKSEKQLTVFFNDFKSWATNFCIMNKTASLLPLTCIDPDNWNTPFLVWSFPKEDAETETHERIKVMSGTLTDSVRFTFHDSMIRQHFTQAEMSSVKNISDANFIFDLLFEIPEPISLTSSQIHLVRNDINKVSSKLFGEMKNLNEELKEISFGKNNFEKITSLYNEKISHLKTSIQKTITENSCFNELKNDNSASNIYRVYAGISSFTTILDFYKELGIIDVSDVLYIREDMTSAVDINNSRLFLFLEPADNTINVQTV